MLCDPSFRVFSLFFFFKQKTAYEMRISDWSSDVCSSDLLGRSRSAPSGSAARDRPRGDRADYNAAPTRPSARPCRVAGRHGEEGGRAATCHLWFGSPARTFRYRKPCPSWRRSFILGSETKGRDQRVRCFSTVPIVCETRRSEEHTAELQ